MLHTGVIENYTLKRARAEHNQDYVMIAKIEPPKSLFEKRIFGDAKKVRFMIPQYGGFRYDNKMHENYNLLVTIDDDRDYSGDVVDYVHAVPVPKNIVEEDIDGTEDSKTMTMMTKGNIKSDYSIMKSSNGESFVSVSDESVYLTVGDTSSLVMGDKGTTVFGGFQHMALPSNDHFIIKETGILRLLPKCFIPPFALPDYLPSVEMIKQAFELKDNLNELKKAIKGG